MGVGGREPSTGNLDEPVRSLDPVDQVQRLNTNVAALAMTIAISPPQLVQ